MMVQQTRVVIYVMIIQKETAVLRWFIKAIKVVLRPVGKVLRRLVVNGWPSSIRMIHYLLML